jgi:hypothetical protein
MKKDYRNSYLFVLMMGILILPNFGIAQELEADSLHPVNVTEIEDQKPFIDYIQKNGKTPVEYLIEKFKSHDIIILGETHSIKENCEFISTSLKTLYQRANLRFLATEFIKTINSELTNKLVTDSEYDQNLAIQIFRDHAWPTWGYQEYVDIFKAVWEVNQSLPQNAERLKVVCLDYDWNQYDTFYGPKKDDRVHKFNERLAREEHMTKTAEEAINKEGNVLVHIGFDHTFTKIPPKFASVLYEKYGDRVLQVGLHMKYASDRKKNPALIPFIEEIMDKNGNIPIGFDIVDSPFSPLFDNAVLYFQHPVHKTFSDLVQGIIFLKPINQLRKVTWIDNFINEDSFEKAVGIAKKMRWIKKGERINTPAELNKKMSELFPGK